MSKSAYRNGQAVRHQDGRLAWLIRRNKPYAQWLVRLSDGTTRWWWESTLTAVTQQDKEKT